MAFYHDVARAFSKAGALDFSGIGKAISLSDSNVNQVARNVARKSGAALNTERHALMEAMDKMSGEELTKATEQLTQMNTQLAGLQATYKNGTMDSVNSALKEVTGKDKMGYLKFAQGYFGDKTYGKTRVKAAVGAYAAGAVGTRYLSGGSLTSNAQGERDIAGIPFI